MKGRYRFCALAGCAISVFVLAAAASAFVWLGANYHLPNHYLLRHALQEIGFAEAEISTTDQIAGTPSEVRKTAESRTLEGQPHKAEPKRQAEEDRLVKLTTLHTLKLDYYPALAEGHLALEHQDGRTLSFFHATQKGSLSHVRVELPPHEQIDASPSLRVKLLVAHIPKQNGVERLTDILVSKGLGLLVSYVHLNASGCASLKVDRLLLRKRTEQLSYFETTPCLPSDYALHQSGGRMAYLDDGSLLLTVGDFNQERWSQNLNMPYGKILKLRKVQLADLDAPNHGASNYYEAFSRFSLGHRNPQGILFDRELNRILATEHGPQGGDELNIIEAGQNYGWPLESYGLPYGADPERLSDTQTTKFGSHESFKRPLFAFVPSIGIGALEKIPSQSTEFPRWRGNYLAAGMKARSIERLVFAENRVIYAESLDVGLRIRDLFVSPSGVIVASTTKGLVIIQRKRESKAEVSAVGQSH